MRFFSVVRGSAAVSRRKPSNYRSAGACPPRSSDLHEKRPMPRGRGRFLSRSLHGEGQALALRWQRRFLCLVARGPVPHAFLFSRSRSAGACPPRSADLHEKRPMPKGPRTFFVTIDAWRGTGPRPTVNGGFLFPVARGPVPRDAFS